MCVCDVHGFLDEEEDGGKLIDVSLLFLVDQIVDSQKSFLAFVLPLFLVYLEGTTYSYNTHQIGLEKFDPIQ